MPYQLDIKAVNTLTTSSLIGERQQVVGIGGLTFHLHAKIYQSGYWPTQETRKDHD